jgi:hypothetical protein
LRNIVERLVILSGAIINGQDVRMFANPGKWIWIQLFAQFI